MALDEHDLVQIENALHKTLSPIQRLVEKHEYALFGMNGDEGLCKIVRENQKFRMKIVGGFVIAQILLTAIVVAAAKALF